MPLSTMLATCRNGSWHRARVYGGDILAFDDCPHDAGGRVADRHPIGFDQGQSLPPCPKSQRILGES